MTISLETAGARCVQILANLSKEAEDGAGDSFSPRFMTDEADVERLSRTSTQYTSLRDLIAVSPNTRRSRGSGRGTSPRSKDMTERCDLSEVKFKNNLLKLAAIAYLQPTGKRTSSPESHFFFAQAWETFNAKNVSLLRQIKAFFYSKAQACELFFVEQATRIMKHLEPYNKHLFRAIWGNRRSLAMAEGRKAIHPQEAVDVAGRQTQLLAAVM